MIDVTKMPNNGRVIFGATVTVLNLDSDEEQTYRIVGDEDVYKRQGLCIAAPASWWRGQSGYAAKALNHRQ